jgi:phenylacetaldehyde dehydrogenase
VWSVLLSSIRLGELVLEAGFPPGVVNIVTGFGQEAGNALAAHMDVDKIAFTGSTRTGRAIIDAAKGNLKKVTLELGGKSPAIFFDDCNLDIAIGGAANAVTFNSGQICVAGSRLYAHKSIFDRMVAGVADIMDKMPLGNGLDRSIAIGPMVSALQADKVDGYIQLGLEGGAEAVVGGGKADATGGFFIKPTVLVNTQPMMQCVTEEIFGPVLVCMPFDDVDDVIRQANNSVYGLSASIWTENHSRAIRLSRRLKVGTVWINSHLLFDESVPIGGYKQSGFGRDQGAQAIENYLQTKTVFAAIQ